MQQIGISPRQQFMGFDHVDVRVTSLELVEGFYDRLMPLLGLTRKRTAFVDPEGEWLEADPAGSYNTVEYFTPHVPGATSYFIGFIEHRAHVPSLTRIAFRVEDPPAWLSTLEQLGARNIEPSAEMSEYPAIFFEDPAGTKLELVARRPE